MKNSIWTLAILQSFLLGCQYSGQVTTDDVISVLDAYKGLDGKADYLRAGDKFVKNLIEGNPVSSITYQLLEGKELDEISFRPKVGFIKEFVSDSSGVSLNDVNANLLIGNSLPDQMPYEILESSFNKRLNEVGKGLYGVNEADGSIYAIGFAQTGITPSNDKIGFQESRSIAFRKAELMAKIDILNTITGADLTNYSVWEDVSRSISADVNSESKIEDNSVERFLQVMSSQYSGFLKGCQVVQSSEGRVSDYDYQVAVVVKFSPENYKRAVSTSNYYLGNQGGDLAILDQLRSTSHDELLLILGSRTYETKNGPILVGFGQAEVLTSNSSGVRRAYQKAELKAKNSLQLFLAEQIAGQTEDSVEEVFETKLSVDNRQSVGQYNSHLIQQFSARTEAVSQTINLNTRLVHRWRGVHPISGRQTVGVILVLSNSYKPSDFIRSNDSKGTSVSPIISEQDI